MCLAPLGAKPEGKEDQPEDVDTKQEEVSHHHLGQDVLVDNQHCDSSDLVTVTPDNSLIKLSCYTMDNRAACHLPMMFVDKTKVAERQVSTSLKYC